MKFVSTTNGDVGHAEKYGGGLAKTRIKEFDESDRVLGLDGSEVFDIHDGEIMPTLENRKKFVRAIREWEADVVIGPRPNDYHPDHLENRATEIADEYRDKLVDLYGGGKKIKYAEAFEVGEYGRQPTDEELKELFPFFHDHNCF